jgi:CRISPR-associated endonuclease/helicase Cas3
MHYARTASLNGKYLEESRWQPLEEHLLAVSRAASGFGAGFGMGEWAGLAGLWHDLGKYHDDFQQMLHDVSQGLAKKLVDHSTAGAALAWRCVAPQFEGHSKLFRFLLTSTIAGHHSGLPDGEHELRGRVEDEGNVRRLLDVSKLAIPDIISKPQLPRSVDLPDRGDEAKTRIEFLTRFVFSALVDADRLDAKAFQDGFLPADAQRTRLRRDYASIADLQRKVDASIDTLAAAAVESCDVSRYRQAVLRACRNAAELAPGAFRLSVETGGGKTLSSLSFALRHAVRHDKHRVIVVIPFTSIIEQTAEVFRQSLGKDLERNLLEHHSAINEGGEHGDQHGRFDRDAERQRMTTENWDAPIIVTTAVQFFESLFSASPSRCRKLHNIANSVVILDEAQTLPVKLLIPTVDAINQLTRWYGTSVVLSTATQPALQTPFPEVTGVREIVDSGLPKPPPRVRVIHPTERRVEWPELAERLATHEQVLCITHRRADARELTLQLDSRLDDQSTVHLSANMCAEHRSEVIRHIREDLARGHACRVVSTQLVEAGVDLDFPVVYRALGGLDAMIQAAGRCNREGRLGEHGGVLYIFNPPSNPPRGIASSAKAAGELLLKSAAMDGRELDLFDPNATVRYFKEFYGAMQGQMDGEGITILRRQFKFRTVQERYRLIDEAGTTAIVVPFANATDLVDEARENPSSRTLRRLQRSIVNVYDHDLRELQQASAIEPLFRFAESPSTHVLTNAGFYDPRFGLVVAGTSTLSSNLIL